MRQPALPSALVLSRAEQQADGQTCLRPPWCVSLVATSFLCFVLLDLACPHPTTHGQHPEHDATVDSSSQSNRVICHLLFRLHQPNDPDSPLQLRRQPRSASCPAAVVVPVYDSSACVVLRFAWISLCSRVIPLARCFRLSLSFAPSSCHFCHVFVALLLVAFSPPFCHFVLVRPSQPVDHNAKRSLGYGRR